MKKTMKNKLNGVWEKGSSNVFADLEMPNASEKLAKAELAFKINQLLKSRKLKQINAAKLLETNQSKISLLKRGRLAEFSMERLLRYLNLLNQDVEIVIKRKKHVAHHGELRVIYL